MKSLLDFDDAGAADDHPARGVTVGDIRAWHDELERLRSLCNERAPKSRRREEGIDMNDLWRSIPPPKFPKPRD